MSRVRSLQALWQSLRVPAIVGRAQLRSLSNLGRTNSRLRIGLAITLLFGIALAGWSSLRLRLSIIDWQAQGAVTLNINLWLLCFSVGAGMGLVAVLGLPRNVKSEETTLLFTLPLTPARRFRALPGSFFVSNLWFWTPMQAVITACVLLSTLGWSGLLWLFLLQCCVLLAVCTGCVLALLFMRYIVPRRQGKSHILFSCSIVLLIISILLFHASLLRNMQNLLAWLPPGIGLLGALLLLILLWGPGAAPCGRLYCAVIVQAQGNDRAQRAFTIPGTRLLLAILYRYRGLFWALLIRALLNQSRNWLFWGRLLVSWALLALFPLLRSLLRPYGFSDLTLVVAYPALLAVLHILETGPSTLSGEGNRLALYLIAPFSHAQILRARLANFFFFILIEALVMSLLLCLLTDLSPLQFVLASVAITLLILPCVTLLVWGGAWDIDLKQSVESLEDRILHEEGAFTPRKMLLLNVCLLFLAGMLALLWLLPLLPALALLITLNVGIMAGMQWFGLIQLQQALRQG